ncbi:hypothetical protein AM500_04000 [Bacillus sp. FJAT-18017]|uniref:hypothetical protein n=1 Tax=Bacillus sp. FJAT-18017 TaxID=1705566 RepID=UPI0006AE7F35|nr:hypothetical protein [Bacillus sp. FJAT-18017]ALC89048.1 hypothetical protein AM500_04000 [Bacillus sp. FJAT-18017]
MIILNTFSKSNGRYKYEGNGEYAQNAEDEIGYEFITISKPGNLEDSYLWGWINIQEVESVYYSLKGEEGERLYESEIMLNDKNVFIDRIPPEGYANDASLEYKYLDGEGNVVLEHVPEE